MRQSPLPRLCEHAAPLQDLFRRGAPAALDRSAGLGGSGAGRAGGIGSTRRRRPGPCPEWAGASAVGGRHHQTAALSGRRDAVSRCALHRRALPHRGLRGLRRPRRPAGRRLSVPAEGFLGVPAAGGRLPAGPRRRERGARRRGRSAGGAGPDEHVVAQRLEVSGARLSPRLVGFGLHGGQPPGAGGGPGTPGRLSGRLCRRPRQSAARRRS